MNDDDLIPNIKEQVASARTITLFMLTTGVGILAMLYGADYLDIVQGRLKSLPGVGVEVQLSVLLMLGPSIFVLLHILTLHQYRGIAAACEALPNFRDSNQQKKYRAGLPNDPMIQWQLAPDGRGKFSFLIIFFIIIVLPLLILGAMIVSVFPFQDTRITSVNSLIFISYIIYSMIWISNLVESDWKSSKKWSALYIATTGMTFAISFAICLFIYDFFFFNLKENNQNFSLTQGSKLEQLQNQTGSEYENIHTAGQGATYKILRTVGNDLSPIDYYESNICKKFNFGCLVPRLSHRTVRPPIERGGTNAGNSARSNTSDMSESNNLIKLDNRRLRLAVMNSSSLRDTDFSCSDLRGAEMFRADLSNTVLWRTNLYGAGLNGAVFRKSYLRQLDLEGADLRGANFAEAYFQDVRMAQSDLTGVNFAKAVFKSKSMQKEDIYGEYARNDKIDASPHCADGQGEELKDIQGIDLRLARLDEATLTGANLEYAHLEGAYLNRADLRGAMLKGGFLQGAKLRDAKLSAADLRGADLRNVDLSSADLTGADLREAKMDEKFRKMAEGQKALLSNDQTDFAQILAQTIVCTIPKPDSLDGQEKKELTPFWRNATLFGDPTRRFEQAHKDLAKRMSDCIVKGGAPHLDNENPPANSGSVAQSQ